MNASIGQKILTWFENTTVTAMPECYCATRDVFEGRLAKISQSLQRDFGFAEDDSFLLTALIGEIGNNCFDHNLGHWRYEPGLQFSLSRQNDLAIVTIADRGRGIHGSLMSAFPEISSSHEALSLAFEKKISGRHPENRGNGLKFVKQVINMDPKRGLWCRSGDVVVSIGQLGPLALNQASQLLDKTCCGGTATILVWGKA